MIANNTFTNCKQSEIGVMSESTRPKLLELVENISNQLDENHKLIQEIIKSIDKFEPSPQKEDDGIKSVPPSGYCDFIGFQLGRLQIQGNYLSSINNILKMVVG